MIEPPLPFGGAAARWYYVLYTELLNRGHEVIAFAACSKIDEFEKAKNLFPSLHLYMFPKRKGYFHKIKTLLRPYSYMFSSEMLNDVQNEILKGCDIIHLDQMWTGWTALKYTNKALLNIHYLTSIDLEFAVSKTLKEKFTLWLMKRTEKKLVTHFKYIRGITPRLEKSIFSLNNNAQVYFSPFGIDSSLYEYVPDSNRKTGKVISLIASMNWYPGKSAADRLIKEIWPKIKELNPDAKLQIVGWEARKILKDYLELEDVEILENVPNIKEYFEKSSLILYAPTRGSGIKIKILEAMLFGIPVITTEEGVEGLEYKNGIHALVSESNDELAILADKLLNDYDLQQNLRFAARKLVEQQCSPKHTVDELEKIYSKIMSRN